MYHDSSSCTNFIPHDSNLTLSLPACCGMEWMANSPLTQGTAASIFCNGSSLASHPVGQSLCQCKRQQYQRTGECYQTLNYTLQLGPSPVCAQDCPAGQRVYHTGSLLQCTDQQTFASDVFSLYETACQGEVHILRWVIRLIYFTR